MDPIRNREGPYSVEDVKMMRSVKDPKAIRGEGDAKWRKMDREPASNTKEDKFVSKKLWADNELKEKTVGLIQLEEFQKIKENIDKGKPEEKCESRKNVRMAKKHVLSFDPDEEEQENTVFLDSKDKPPIIKVKKNPCIDTSFLPDREREEKDKLEREQLKMQWIKEQEATKAEKIKITYSYWDGIGSRDCVECKKGDTIGKFLDICRQRWPELRGVSVDNLMYIKEDLIIPHHYRFYDFIVNKTRGKSGPLFSFDVYEDVRFLNDATVETQESHSGKVIKRSWYEKNKHIFPANRWEVFDPRKDFGKYSIKDKISKN